MRGKRIKQESKCTFCFKACGSTCDLDSVFQFGPLISKRSSTPIRRHYEKMALVQFAGVLYSDTWKQQLLFYHQY